MDLEASSVAVAEKQELKARVRRFRADLDARRKQLQALEDQGIQLNVLGTGPSKQDLHSELIEEELNMQTLKLIEAK